MLPTITKLFEYLSRCSREYLLGFVTGLLTSWFAFAYVTSVLLDIIKGK